jgi:hypothetical protein
MDDQVQEEKPSVDSLAQTYIKMRDKREVLKRDWEAKDTAIKTQMEVIEQALLDAPSSLLNIRTELLHISSAGGLGILSSSSLPLRIVLFAGMTWPIRRT